MLDKSGPLMVWAAKNAAEAAVLLGADGLAQLVATVGEQGAIKALSDRANWKRDEAAQLGHGGPRMGGRDNQRVDPLPALSETAKLYTRITQSGGAAAGGGSVYRRPWCAPRIPWRASMGLRWNLRSALLRRGR